AASGLVTLADKGYIGAGEHVRVPYRGRNKPASQKAANRAHAQLRSPAERANAQLKTWRLLRKLHCCPWRAGQLAKAIHALQTRESEVSQHPAGRGRALLSWIGHVPALTARPQPVPAAGQARRLCRLRILSSRAGPADRRPAGAVVGGPDGQAGAGPDHLAPGEPERARPRRGPPPGLRRAPGAGARLATCARRPPRPAGPPARPPARRPHSSPGPATVIGVGCIAQAPRVQRVRGQLLRLLRTLDHYRDP